jgi:hypothetical protein
MRPAPLAPLPLCHYSMPRPISTVCGGKGVFYSGVPMHLPFFERVTFHLPALAMILRTNRRLIAFLLLLMYTAACADSTMPEGRTRNSGTLELGQANPSAAYLLDPIDVSVPWCDPFTDANFCQGEVCLSDVAPVLGDFSTVTSCGTGTGGSSGGGLPGDSDGDGDTWDQGPGAWILCVTSALSAVGGGGAGTYFALQDYYYKVDLLNAARLRLDTFLKGGGASGPEYWELSTAVHNADREAGIARGVAATTLGVSILALIGAGVVCAPLIAAPTL